MLGNTIVLTLRKEGIAMTNGGGQKQWEEQKEVQKKNSPKPSKKGTVDRVKEQSTTKERTQ